MPKQSKSLFVYPPAQTVFAADISLTATGLVLLEIAPPLGEEKTVFATREYAIEHKPPLVKVLMHQVCKPPDAKYPMTRRLGTIFDATRSMLSHAPVFTTIGIEALAWGGSKAPSLALAQGAVQAAIWDWYRGNPPRVVEVTPQATKVVACPAWPGWSHERWKAAGRTSEYKRSQPDKDSVMSGVSRRFDFHTLDEHTADAICVGVAAYAKSLHP